MEVLQIVCMDYLDLHFQNVLDHDMRMTAFRDILIKKHSSYKIECLTVYYVD